MVSYAQTIIRGPYLQIGTQNSIVIRWRTDINTNSRIRYGENSLIFVQSVDSLSLKTEHEIKLTGLVSNTKYYYSVETSTEVLSSGFDHYFVTSPPLGTKEKTRIWILGDSGTANEDANAVKKAYYNFTGSTHTDLWLMLGDNAYYDGSDAEFQNAVFEMYSSMLKKSVLWPTFGNHDGRNANSNTQTGVFYDIFTLPTNAEAGGAPSRTEAYYSFDYANIHFICLNSHNIDRSINGQMLAWLKKDIELTAQEWIVAYWHHPAYSKGGHNSDNEYQSIEMRKNILPVLEKGGVDLVFYGHTHTYERSYLINGHYGYSWELADSMILNYGDGKVDGDGAYSKRSSNLTPNEGTVYITAGSSGKILSLAAAALEHPAINISHNKLGSIVLDIEGSRANITFLDSEENNLDYFTLYKGPPLLSDFPDTSFYEDSSLYMNLNDFVYDNGDADSTLEFRINGNDQIIVNIDSVNNFVYFSSLSDLSGFSENISINVTDPWGARDTETFVIKVLPVQDAPYPFKWVSISIDTISITTSNIGDTYDLEWSESKDVDQEVIDYLIFAQIGVYPAEEIYDTTITTLPLTYQEISDIVFEPFPMLPRVTVKFSVSATDGIDTIKVTGDDRIVFVNRYEYLSTVSEGIPLEFALHENYPNPFNPTTTLRFDLPEVSDITLIIYNMLGQKVRTFNYQNTSAGYHSVKWNATNDYGDPVGAGVYLYQLQTKDFVKTRKMVLLK